MYTVHYFYYGQYRCKDLTEEEYIQLLDTPGVDVWKVCCEEEL